jgi:hypothetical protein
VPERPPRASTMLFPTPYELLNSLDVTLDGAVLRLLSVIDTRFSQNGSGKFGLCLEVRPPLGSRNLLRPTTP